MLPFYCIAGAWRVGSFENDSALDWVYELETTNSSNFLITTMNQVMDPNYIDADLCSAALAASEIVASLNKNNTAGLPDEVRSWIATNSVEPSTELRLAAMKAVSNCLSSEKSELARLWQESLPEEWTAYMSELKSRL